MKTFIDFEALPKPWHVGFYARINGTSYADNPYTDSVDRLHWQTGHVTASNKLLSVSNDSNKMKGIR